MHGIFSKQNMDHFRWGEGHLAALPGLFLKTVYTGILGKTKYIPIKRHCSMHGALHILFDMIIGLAILKINFK